MDDRVPVSAAEAAAMEAACIGLAAQRLARAVGRRYDAAYRPVGLSGWQFTLLMATCRSLPPTISEHTEEITSLMRQGKSAEEAFNEVIRKHY